MNSILSSLCLIGGVVVLTLIALAIIKDLFSKTNYGRVARFLVEVGPEGSDISKPSISRLQMLIWNGDPKVAKVAPMWKKISATL